MALSGKERQQKYRERLKQKHAQKLDIYLPNDIYVMLDSLSSHGDVSKRDYLFALIKKEFERKVTSNEDGFYDFMYGVKPNNANDNLDLFEDTSPYDNDKPW